MLHCLLTPLVHFLRYATKEFEVTTARLGCYQPTEHIDNPKGYADGEDATQYDRRLRGPVDERRELAIDEKTGMTAPVKPPPSKALFLNF